MSLITTIAGKILAYLDLRTMFSRENKKNFNLRMMHGMNRISIFLFLICLILLIFRYILA